MVYHYGMRVPYERSGRIQQKARTRDALIAATRRLLSEGRTPTLESAAAAASVSRTTAYRYFPDQRALLVAAYPHIEVRSLLGPEPPEDVVARLAIVADDQTRRILTFEPEMRAVLRLSLEDDPGRAPELPMNRGLRIGWIEDALSPLTGRMPLEPPPPLDQRHRRHTRHRSVRVAHGRRSALEGRGGGDDEGQRLIVAPRRVGRRALRRGARVPPAGRVAKVIPRVGRPADADRPCGSISARDAGTDGTGDARAADPAIAARVRGPDTAGGSPRRSRTGRPRRSRS